VLDQQVVFDINKTEAYIRRADGWTQFFTQQNGIWVAENGSGDDLKEHLDGTWSFLDSSGQTTVFNRTGRIIRITQPTGDSLYISWNGGRWPTGVSNDTKKLLDITVNTVTNLVEVIIDSTGLRVTYGYENERLESVNFSFAGSSLGTVNYDYDDPNLHYLLTGLRDEENDAYATWEYNSKAEAIYSGHGVVDSEGKRKEEVSLLRHGDGTTTVTNPFGKETVYRTERYLGASKVTHVEGVSTSNCLPSNAYLSYDDIGNRDFVTDAKGNVTDYDYNTLGQMTRKIEGLVWEGESRTNAVVTPNTRTTEWVWDPENHLIDMIEQPNVAVDYDYYPNQRIQRVTRTDKTNITNSFGSTLGQQRVWLFEYTYHEVPGVTEGTLVSSVSIDGPLPGTSDVTTTKYDSDGQRTEFINALSHTTYYRDHNSRGQPQTIENSNGVITQLSYHPRGWLTHVTVKSPDGDPTKDSATQYDYYANGLLKQVISPDGSSIFYEYNEARHVIEIRNNMGESQILTPNEEGKWEAIETKNASLALTRQQNRVFDELGRVMDLFGQNNQHQHVDYNVNDQIDTVTDYGVERTLTSSHQYDFLNRLSQVIRPTTLLIDGQPELVSVETVMDYDAHDNLASVVDPEGNETQYISNGFNERVTQISPDTGTTENWYDAAGNLEHSQDARGTQKDYIYDPLNRLTQIKYPASTLEDVNYFYDEVSASNPYAKGLLTRITDPTGSTSFVYDHRANISAVTRVIGGQIYSIAYQYNLANNLIAITYPSGRIVNYHRADDLGRISAVSMLAPGSSVPKILVTDIQYAPFGPITQFTYGNGLQRSVPLDLDYRIESISVAEGPLEKLNVSYTYDLFNNIKTITNLKDSARSQSFIYDDLLRIQDAFGAYGNGTDHIHYEYDLVGNRLLRSLSQSSAVFSSEAYTYFPDSNQLESVTEARGEAVNVRQFTYDAAGLPQTEITLGNKSRVLNFGDNQRFNELTEEGETLATYQHDGFGQRAYKKAAVETHFYFGLNGELLGESLGENSVRREYVYLAGQPIAQFKRDVSDLQLTAEFTRDGATVDYVLSVLNVGPDPALNITLQNQLPDDVVINSIMPSAGSCQETVLLISCELGDLTANQDITISVQFTASASVDADALATASVSSDTPDQNMANNSVEFTPDDVCFIATAAFGSMQHSNLHILRDFRDNYLLPTGPGQWFVKQYYDYSPPIARWISGNEIAKTVTRVLLLPMILLAWFIQSSVMTKALVTMLIIAVYTGAKRFLLVNKVWHQRKKWLAVLVAAIAMISSATQAEELYYIHTNHLGAPSVLTDEEQNVVWEGDYRPFGEVVDIISNVDQPIRFPGQYEDTESNYYYNYFRDYDPGLGRYLQSDPIGLGGGINTYAYVSGNPVMAIDPSGLLQQCQVGISTTGGYDIGPFHHDYHCWTGREGERVCRGYSFSTSSGAKLYDKVMSLADGEVLKDEENSEDGQEETCTEDDNDSCMDTCASGFWSEAGNNPPFYGLIRGQTCQTLASNIYNVCKSMCSAMKK